MRYLSGFEDFLFEYKVSIEDIYQKYYKDIDYNTFLEIISSDPTTNIEKKLLGSYSKWLLNLYKLNNLKLEDLYKAKEYLELFNSFKHKIIHKDINFYESLPELFQVIEPFKEKEEFKFSNDEERKLAGQFKEVFRNNDYRIIIPLTLEASKYFGCDTEWCTLNTDMFKHYTRRQSEDITPYNLYILYPLKNNEKLQFHFKSKQFMDIKDREINIEEFFNENKNIFNFFNKYFDVNIYTKPIESVIWRKNTLIGSPEEINGRFYCSDIKLTSLEGCPKVIIGYFDCSDNKLTTLDGSPIELDGAFFCNNNKLTTLQGAPEIIYGDFYCSKNELTSLEGAPKKIYGSVNCKNNKLTSLQGAPEIIENDFDCSDNKNLSKEEIIKYKNTGAVKGKIYSDYGQF